MAGWIVGGVVAWKIYRYFYPPEEEPNPPPPPRPPSPVPSRSKQKSYSPPPPRPSSTPSPSRSTFTWTEQQGYEAVAAAFSAIAAVKFISQNEVQKALQLGKKVKAVEIKDVFYGGLSSSQNQVQDQEQLYYVPDSAYDPQFDYDFTNYKGDDTNCTRGGYPYKRPAGWNRKAVSVIGKYEDDVWLGKKGWRDGSSPGEWVVSYHGTKIQNVPSIVADGYDTKKSKRQAYGPGIYSTPDIEVAERYATKFNYKGENCRCILQNRVNLNKTREHKTPKGIYFVTPDDEDIRPYGVCIKKI